MKIFKIVCGAGALIFLITSCGKKQNSSEQVPIQAYPTIVVNEQDAELSSVYPITIKGQEDVEIRPRIDGFIEAVYIDEGSIVRKGQSLFKINSPETEQILRTAQAALKSANAQVNTAKINVERVRPLVEKKIVSNIQLTTAEDSYQTALASLAQAEAALKNAQATMSWTNVSSPVDGVIGVVTLRLGSLVSKSDVLTTVSSTNNVFAYFSLNENELKVFLDKTEGQNQLEKIKNIPPVTLQLSDGGYYSEKGKIHTISGIIDISTGSSNFRAEFPNKDGKLRSGASGKIIIPEHISAAMIIPQKSTFAHQDKILVYKVQGDSVKQTMIQIKEMPDGKNYVVTEGLSVGDVIVSDGIATLSEGKKINIKK